MTDTLRRTASRRAGTTAAAFTTAAALTVAAPTAAPTPAHASASPAAASANSRSAPSSLIRTGSGANGYCLTGVDGNRVETLPCLPVFGASRLWERHSYSLFNVGQNKCLTRQYNPPNNSVGLVLGCLPTYDPTRDQWVLTQEGQIRTEQGIPAEGGNPRCLTFSPTTSAVQALPCQPGHPQQKWHWRFF